MEILEKEEEKENYRSTKILLIINLIIWGIILFMAILWNGVVNAATTTKTITDIESVNSSGTPTSWGNSSNSHTLSGQTQRIGYIWGYVDAGYYEGHITLELTYPGRYDINKSDIGVQCRGSSTALTCASSISWEKSVSSIISTYKISIWFNGNLTQQEWFQVRVLFPTNNYLPSGTSFKGTGSIDWTESDAATNTTINNAVTQIIQNAVENTTTVSQQIIQSNTDLSNAIANIMNNATTSIQNSILYGHCDDIDKSYIEYPNMNINNNGNNVSNTGGWGATDYIEINKNWKIYYTNGTNSSIANFCFYNNEKSKISCTLNSTTLNNTEITIPNNSKYLRVSINSNGQPTFRICKSNADAIIENQNQNTAEIIAAIGGLEGYHTHYTPDTDGFDIYEEAESDLMAEIDVDLNDVEIDIDSDTSNWVWNTMTAILNTNSLIFGMVITILSIGVIKLLLRG